MFTGLFGMPEGTLVETHSVFKQFCDAKLQQTLRMFLLSPQSHGLCGDPEIKRAFCATQLDIIKSPKRINPLWAFWYAGRDSNPRPTGS